MIILDVFKDMWMVIWYENFNLNYWKIIYIDFNGFVNLR